jgi:hypothetical protein
MTQDREISELDKAYRHLSVEQMRAIEKMFRSHGISAIACKLSLTRSFVHSYVRKLNRGER